jgi:hypothetical protein
VPNLKSSTAQTHAVNKALGSGHEVLVPQCTSQLPFGQSQNKFFKRKKKHVNTSKKLNVAIPFVSLQNYQNALNYRYEVTPHL